MVSSDSQRLTFRTGTHVSGPSAETQSSTQKAKPSRIFIWVKLRLKLLIALTVMGLILIYTGIQDQDHNFLEYSQTFQHSYMRSTIDASSVGTECLNLPIIRPHGLSFLNQKVKSVSSPDGVTPSFKIGTMLGPKVAEHMSSDLVHFQLINELMEEHGSKGGLTFDFGANQGFFTYYLAALGMNVHSFEIYEPNFIPLQHGMYFNSKEIADRVNLYPLGIGEKVGRFSLSGKDYGGFLKDGNDGAILGVSFDCFAYHTKLNISNVAFVKIDVEGYEIAALKGAHKSLFSNTSRIGGMLMEVGPARWKRAQVDLTTGIVEMKKLSTHFRNSYLLIRTSGGHWEGCPPQLVDGILVDDKPRVIDNVNMYKVQLDEWKPLLTKMETKDYDCNFWYIN